MDYEIFNQTRTRSRIQPKSETWNSPQMHIQFGRSLLRLFTDNYKYAQTPSNNIGQVIRFLIWIFEHKFLKYNQKKRKLGNETNKCSQNENQKKNNHNGVSTVSKNCNCSSELGKL